MRPRRQALGLCLLVGVGEGLLGCGSSSGGRGAPGQDASSDTTAADVVTEVGAADVRAGGASTSVEAGSRCSSSADCDPGNHLFCGFPTDGGCSALGSCIDLFVGGCACDAGGALVCTCAGDLVAPSCCYPPGYQPFALAPSDSCVSDGGPGQGADAVPDGAIDAGAE